MTANLNSFIEKVLHCTKTECPFHNLECGYYPRFAYGNVESKIMAVFQNPGSPKRNDYNLSGDNIFNATYEIMNAEARAGIEKWLFSENKNFTKEHFALEGKTFLETFYITQSYRCADPANEKKELWKFALENCNEYLKEEIEIINPEVIFAFGGRALLALAKVYQKLNFASSSILEITKIANSLKKNFEEMKTIKLENGVVIIPIVHPDGVWKKPHMEKSLYTSIIKKHLDAIHILS